MSFLTPPSLSRMRAASHDEQNIPAPPSLPQPPSATSSATPDIGDVKSLINDDAAEAGEKPKRETKTREADAAESEEQPKQETRPGTPTAEMPMPSAAAAAPPETPGHAAETAMPAAPAAVGPDVDTVKPDNENPPPPAHDSEGSDTQSVDVHGSPQKEKLKPCRSDKRDVATSTSRLLAFRSFARDRKAKRSGDAAPPGGRVPSPGEEGKVQKEKDKERRGRFWR